MKQQLLLRVTGPAVLIGLVLFVACLFSMRYINRLQTSLANVLAENVTSLQAAQELEIQVNRLRFHSLLYLYHHQKEVLESIDADQLAFETALKQARSASREPDEVALVGRIEDGYRLYQKEQLQLRTDAAQGKTLEELSQRASSHHIHEVVDPCQDLLKVNKDKMERTATESQNVSEEAYLALLFLGLAGPVGGLVMGYGVARGLRQSIYRLSVRVQDVAQRLSEKVASVSVAANGDLRGLDQQVQHIVARVEEVTERVQQQQRELLRTEQLSAVGQLAAGVAHEIRNPLTGIKLVVEAALRPRNPRPLGQEDVRMIHREVARLEHTVQGFLDFARLPAPQRAACDLVEVVRQACDLVRVRAGQQQVRLDCELPGQPLTGCVDRGQITTVLVNLFLNALDVMPHGGTLHVHLQEPAGGVIRLRVSDTGPGIPAEMAARLFTPFATTKPTGTGLGLSISRRILEEHGATITAVNLAAGGACFTLTLPGSAAEVACAEVAGH
jgi:two-component system sensor histidine kinase HydH